MVLIENIFGEPNKEILFNLFNFIKKVYGTENCTILWWDGQINPLTKIVNLKDIEFLQKFRMD